MENYTETLIESILDEGNTNFADKAFSTGIITQKDIDECQFIYQLAQRIPGYKVNGNKVSDSTRAAIINSGIKYGFDMSKYGSSSLVPKKGTGMSDDDWFTVDNEHNNTHTKTRLNRLGIEYKCAICGNTGQWQDKELVLQLDHINGDHTDNRLENLRYLCPNCHSQTDTYARPAKKYK